MLVYDISFFIQNATRVFNAALSDQVIIKNNDGMSYKILPINDVKGKSPLEDIPYITADITTQEMIDLIREGRAGV